MHSLREEEGEEAWEGAWEGVWNEEGITLHPFRTSSRGSGGGA